MMIDNPQTRTGVLVEYGETIQIFTQPENQQTEDYVTGRLDKNNSRIIVILLKEGSHYE